MCDECAKLTKQLGAANNYYVSVLDELGKLAKAAGLQTKTVAKLDAIAVVKEVTKAFKDAVQRKAVVEASKQDAVAMNEAFESLPEVWQQEESIDWLKETSLDPQQIDNMVELFALIGFTAQRLQFVLTSSDMATALKRCG